MSARQPEYNPTRILFANKADATRLRGVSDVLYAEIENCEVYRGDIPETVRKARMFDAAIMYVGGPDDLEVLRGFNRPTVVINNMMAEVPYPQVLPDDPAIGRMAADYFLHRGFRRFLYAGDDSGFGILRGNGFIQALSEAGIEDVARPEPGGRNQILVVQDIIARHPNEPVAVFACNDWRGHAVIHHARANGLRCPEQVAVLGVNNNPIANACCYVKISSVENADYELGKQAAKLLLRLIAGEPPPDEPILVPPVRVIGRKSSDRYATNDRALKKALNFIEANIENNISVSDIAKAVSATTPVRTLQRHFKEAFGVSMIEALLNARVNRAKELLATSGLSIKEIAYVTGFPNPSHFGAQFRKLEGITPGQFRKRTLYMSR